MTSTLQLASRDDERVELVFTVVSDQGSTHWSDVAATVYVECPRNVLVQVQAAARLVLANAIK